MFLEYVFKNHTFDCVVNCSGSGDVGKSFEDPKNDFLLNTQLVLDQLELIRKFLLDSYHL